MSPWEHLGRTPLPAGHQSCESRSHPRSGSGPEPQRPGQATQLSPAPALATTLGQSKTVAVSPCFTALAASGFTSLRNFEES